MFVIENGFYGDEDGQGLAELPISIPDDISDEDKAQITKVLNRMNLLDRANIKTMIFNNIDINRLIGASHIIEMHNRKQGKQNFAFSMGLGGQAAMESLKSGIKKYHDYAKEFDKATTKLEGYQHELAEGKLSAKEFKSVAANDYEKSVDAMNKAAKLNMITTKTKRYYHTMNHVVRMSKRRIYISDLADAAHLVKIAKTARMMGRGLWAFSAVAGADQVYHTYQRGGDWEKQAVGIGTELAVTGAVADAIADVTVGFLLAATPVGWVALAATAIAAGLVSIGVGKFVEDKAEELYGWAEHYAKRWF